MLGVTQSSSKTHFALFSKHATGVLLRLFEVEGADPFHEVELKREGDIWEITLENLPQTFEYTYRCDGPYEPQQGHLFNREMDLIDPYATLLNRSPVWNAPQRPTRGVVTPPEPFDWEGDSRPFIPPENMILYELHVRGFTQDPSSGVKHPGTFLGMIEKIPYLKDLGVNAIELLPIHTFNEREHPQRLNFWGYSTANFFCPMRPYGSAQELKALVKACHQAGIEVILDVVYNHTNEGSFPEYYYSLRGIDNASYYIVDANGYHNYSGCGNTLNCNHPAVAHLIVDSLRHFVEEYHIDGFRFDLAPILTRGQDGSPLENPPVLQMIERDPILGPTKLIAEAWDAAGLYQLGKFPSYRFGEWNGKFRDDVRHFIRGDGNKEVMKTRLLGSPDLYETPSKSYNFITIHDGFTLRDLVSYNEKHNEANGEGNQDGSNDNLSWNCGVEGPTDTVEINRLRTRQMKNFFLALLVAQGIPMLLVGDEYGHTKKGNNNTWCQDNSLNYFQWNQEGLQDYLRELITFRKTHLTPIKTVEWIDLPFLACIINEKILVAFNPSDTSLTWTLPERDWKRVIDTYEEGESFTSEYCLHPFSSILLIAT
ncbi:MAG: glycogen-debranching protein [Chlamydiia bacterium]|nr:glycogen-debranching protein [Chlamydiia bacterium]